MIRIFSVLFLCSLLASPALAQQAREQRRIDYLIAAIGELRGAVFIRNGSEHTAPEAADHLRTKLRLAGARVRTAEDFIVLCVTGSSISGEKYRIRFADGHTVDSADFFRGKLAAYTAPD